MSAETEVEIDGQVYLIGRLDAFKQFHVARRLAPIMAAIGQEMAQLPAVEDSDKDKVVDQVMRLITPAASVLALMPEKDVDYVLHTCLSVTKRRGEKLWAPLMSTGGQLMFQDISMQTMLRLTVETVRSNIGEFFQMLPGATP